MFCNIFFSLNDVLCTPVHVTNNTWICHINGWVVVHFIDVFSHISLNHYFKFLPVLTMLNAAWKILNVSVCP